MLILGNTAHTTTESSQHCFLGTQTGKHLWEKQNVSEKIRNIFCFSETKYVSAKKKCFVRAQTGKHLRETCFLNNVSPFAGALTREQSPPAITLETQVEIKHYFCNLKGNLPSTSYRVYSK